MIGVAEPGLVAALALLAALTGGPATINDALYSAFGTRQVSTIYTPSNEYWVILELEPEFQASPEALSLAVRVMVSLLSQSSGAW